MSKLALPLSTFLLFSGLLTCVSLLLSSLLACLFTLDCSHGLPTISFVAKFPLHRECFILLISYFSFPLLSIALALNSLLRDIEGCYSAWVGFIGLSCIPILLSVAIVNMSISQTAHLTLAFLFLALSLFYFYSVRLVLLPRHPLFLSHLKEPLRSMFKWDAIIWSSTLLLMLEVYFANRTTHNHVLNEILKAVSEHILVAAGIMQPYVLSRLFPRHRISLGKEVNI